MNIFNENFSPRISCGDFIYFRTRPTTHPNQLVWFFSINEINNSGEKLSSPIVNSLKITTMIRVERTTARLNVMNKSDEMFFVWATQYEDKRYLFTHTIKIHTTFCRIVVTSSSYGTREKVFRANTEFSRMGFVKTGFLRNFETNGYTETRNIYQTRNFILRKKSFFKNIFFFLNFGII